MEWAGTAHSARSSTDNSDHEYQNVELENLQIDSESASTITQDAELEPSELATGLLRTSSRSSSISSKSVHRQRTKHLLARIQSVFGRPFNAIKSWKQQSRFHGWQWGVMVGSITGTAVLLANCTFILIGALSGPGYEEGIATIFSGNSTRITQLSTVLHILINVLSTLLLSASNYAMQVLSAPTRDECEVAHRQGRFLDVGILSIRNISSISLRRKVLWSALALSSVPLHLFYNASVFQVVTGGSYTTNLVLHDTPEWHALNASTFTEHSNLTSITVAEARNTYSQEYVSGYGDVILTFTSRRVEYYEYDTDSPLLYNISFPVIDVPLAEPNYDTSSAWWAVIMDQDGWTSASSFNENWTAYAGGIDVELKVIGGFAYPGADSHIQLSLPFLLIVVICNTAKVACLIFMLFGFSVDKNIPLVTVGDAVAAFLDTPDESTRGYCTYSKSEYFWKTGRLKRTLACEEDGRAAKWDRRCEGIWEQRTHNYGSAISRRKRVLLSFLGIILPIFMLLVPFVAFEAPITPWATASPLQFTVGRMKFDGNTTSRLAFIANSPQLLLSVIYLYYNNMFTSMALAYEWNQFGTRRKGLRVTKPQGEQRETYFLQLPLKIGVPLNSLSGLLHWLASQMLFVVRFDQRDRNGALDTKSSIAACGFSSSALLALGVVLVILSLITIVLGFRTFEAHLPFAGSCSWVISAACHPDPGETEVALGRVKWGSIAGGGGNNDTVGHCSFSSRSVKRPIIGKAYA